MKTIDKNSYLNILYLSVIILVFTGLYFIIKDNAAALAVQLSSIAYNGILDKK
jgi:hypothetical protein